MKTLFIHLACLLLCSTVYQVRGQLPDPALKTTDTVSVIRNIRKQYLFIDSKLTTYKKKEGEISGHSSEGESVNGYYDRAFLIKATTVFYFEMGKTETTYYFDKDGLFFQYKKDTYYDMPMYIKEFKIQKTEETRLYFHKNEMIRWVFNKTVKPTGSKAFKELNSSTKAAVKEIRMALKR